MDTELLKVEDLHTVLFPGPLEVLREISFSVRKGEIVGVVGESGSGKTLLAYSLLRLLPRGKDHHPRGKVLFQTRDLLSLPEKEMNKIRGNRITMIFQEPLSALNPVLTVGKQISEPLLYHTALSKKEIREKVLSILEELKIPDPEFVFHQYPFELSGGMRQRVMIAMAIITSPDLLIADEPTTALDVTIERQILGILKSLNRERALAILFITHDIALVYELCSRCVVLYAGEIVEEGKTEEILREPLHPYTEFLLASSKIFSVLFPGEGSLKEKGMVSVREGSPPRPGSYPPFCRFAPRCPYKEVRCEEEKPPLRFIEGRWVRCHRAEELQCSGLDL